MPGFDGATGWLNSPPLTAEDLRAKVVLVDFWTYTCINWLRTLAYVRAWAEKYRGSGLLVVGVHTPEFPFERDIDNVRQAASDLNVWYPIALDSNYEVWQAFSNRYWPAVYIADAEGGSGTTNSARADTTTANAASSNCCAKPEPRPSHDDLVSVTPDRFRGPSRLDEPTITGDVPWLRAEPELRVQGRSGHRSSCHLRRARHVDAQPMGARRGLDDRERGERAERTGWTHRVPLPRARCQSRDA